LHTELVDLARCLARGADDQGITRQFQEFPQRVLAAYPRWRARPSPALVLCEGALADEERNRGTPLLHRLHGFRQDGIQVAAGIQDPVGDAQQLELPRGDLALLDMLGFVLDAGLATPA